MSDSRIIHHSMFLCQNKPELWLTKVRSEHTTFTRCLQLDQVSCTSGAEIHSEVLSYPGFPTSGRIK